MVENNCEQIGSLVFAAGKGSRMEGFEGNKTLLPLVPGSSCLDGNNPILLNILKNLPPGPKAVVVNHGRNEIMEATSGLGISYIIQPETNGTGGALLASKQFLEKAEFEKLIITVGDAPFVRRSTFLGLAEATRSHELVILAFSPSDKKQYGLLRISNGSVKAIVEHNYWSQLKREDAETLRLANAGIYGARRSAVLRFMPELESRPHRVIKKRGGVETEIEEFFITDLVEIMVAAGASVGVIKASDETEVMGVDDISSLKTSQRIFASGRFEEP